MIDIRYKVLRGTGKKLVPSLVYHNPSMDEKEATQMMKATLKKVRTMPNFRAGEDYLITIGTDDNGAPFATCTSHRRADQ